MSLRTVGGPWCVSFEALRFSDTCHTPRSSEPGRQILVGAHPVFYLIYVNGKLSLIKTLHLMCYLCDFFKY